MLVTKTKILLPYKRVIDDLLTRNGKADSESASPYDGLLWLALKRQKEGVNVSILNFLNEGIKDYNPHNQKPTKGEYKKDSNSINYLTHLEDIHQSWVERYVDNVLAGININNRNGIKEYEKHNKTTNVWYDNEGDIKDEAQLLEKKQKYSKVDLPYYKAKLVYTLRRLNNYSCYNKISIISLIIAYEKALKEVNIMREARQTTKLKPKPTDVLDKGVYRCDRKGNIEECDRILKNEGVYRSLYMWVQGEAGYKDSYYKDAKTLLNICKILDVDITEESPFDYQGDYISTLPMTHISENTGYIKAGLIVDNNSIVTNTRARTESLNIEHVIHLFNTSNSPAIIENRDKINNKLCNKIYSKLSTNCTQIILDDSMFYKDIKNRYVKVLVNPIRTEESSIEEYALLHSSGTLVLIAEREDLIYLPPDWVCLFINDMNKAGKKDLTYGRYNSKFGKWYIS